MKISRLVLEIHLYVKEYIDLMCMKKQFLNNFASVC